MAVIAQDSPEAKAHAEALKKLNPPKETAPKANKKDEVPAPPKTN